MIKIVFFCLLAIISLQGFAQINTVDKTANNKDEIHYVSLNHAIRSGQYDGLTTVDELKDHGDFGLGSIEKLEAELVVLDGNAYAIPNTGKAEIANESFKVAFSAIKFFKADQSLKLSHVNSFKQLQKLLDSALAKNSFAAVKISGVFTSIKYTCYQAQEKPYKSIKKVSLTEFNQENIEGTLVGFFTPESAKVINSPVYHFHFIDKAKSTGGHLQEVKLKSGFAEIDYSTELSIQLPDTSMMQHLELNKPLK